VRAIAACPIPIVAGIGHQRDESLSDLAADVCAHTPTAAAELAVPDLQALLNQHHERVASLKQAVRSYLDQVEARLQRSRSRLQQVRLDRRLRQETQVVQWLQQQLIQSVRRQLTTQQQRCYALKQALISIDPTAVLQRGYAVVRNEQGQIVRSVQGLPAGQPLRITFADGTIQVQVTAVEPIPPPTS
jgi:exodeoxyribonuclease VII large subunit